MREYLINGGEPPAGGTVDTGGTQLFGQNQRRTLLTISNLDSSVWLFAAVGQPAEVGKGIGIAPGTTMQFDYATGAIYLIAQEGSVQYSAYSGTV